MHDLQIKRIYDPAHKKDGFRILVDRLWPRGITTKMALLDEWAKEVAPSADLRKWFDHDPAKWIAFGRAYKNELSKSSAVKELIHHCLSHKKVTLLYAAKDTVHNHAIILQKYIERLLKKETS